MKPFSTNDEEGAFFALQKHDRVHAICLRSTSTTLEKLFAAMDGRFSILEELILIVDMDVDDESDDESDDERDDEHDDGCLGLPRTFEAPHLRHLELSRVGYVFEEGLPLLSSLSRLISLELTGIPVSHYLPIECFASRLSSMPCLQYLNLGFDLYDPNEDAGRLLDRVPDVERISLLHLNDIIFQGDSCYLEGLAARISAPHLTTFNALLLREPSPTTLPYLSKFLYAAEELRRCAASIRFSSGTSMDRVALCMACTEMRLDKYSEYAPFQMIFRCNSLNMQVTRTGQICATLAPMFSGVKRLRLDFEGDRPNPLGEEDDIERSRWHDLLRPFRNVLKLQVDSRLMEDLSLALDPDDDGPSAEEILPELCKLARPHYGRFGNTFDGFIAARRGVGRDIIKCRRPPIPRYKSGNEGEEEEEEEKEKEEEEEEEDNEDTSTELDSDVDFK